jgi:hypothetical protein
MKSRRAHAAFAALAALIVGRACSSTPTPAGYRIVASNGAPMTTAVAGDAVALQVVVVMSDGSIAALPPDATVAWTSPLTITAQSVDDEGESEPLAVRAAPPVGGPVAAFLNNPQRADRAGDLTGVLFVLEAGPTDGQTVNVSATIGGSQRGTVATSVSISATPAGDAARGATLYGSSGAACSKCHGPTGHGTVPMSNSDGGTSFMIGDKTYAYAAPGLNAESGNVAADRAWNAALLAIAARSDLDNEGVTLREPMPDWLTMVSPGSNATLTTQDFADIYAFMQTQTK